mmetsp:Transcript_16982/g.25187  ORF Transcript_16982/g.25187 Transcript_16982/m.25187 type:complete len:88 (+) Transcript_16982:769-1032(+)
MSSSVPSSPDNETHKQHLPLLNAVDVDSTMNADTFLKLVSSPTSYSYKLPQVQYDTLQNVYASYITFTNKYPFLDKASNNCKAPGKK